MPISPKRNYRRLKGAARQVASRLVLSRMQRKWAANGKKRWGEEIVLPLGAKFLGV